MTADHHPSLESLFDHRRRPDPDVSAHLASCEDCRAAFAEVCAAADTLAGRGAPPLADNVDVLVAGVLEQAGAHGAASETVPPSASPRRRRVLWPVLLLGLGTSAAAMIGLGVMDLLPPPPVEPTVAPAPTPVPGPAVARPDGRPPPPPEATVRPKPPPPPQAEVVPTAPAEEAPPTEDMGTTLFREATEALAAGRLEEAHGLLLILAELHPDQDVRALRLVEVGLGAWSTDPAQAIRAFRGARQLDPEGPLADDCARWLCELDACPSADRPPDQPRSIETP